MFFHVDLLNKFTRVAALMNYIFVILQYRLNKMTSKKVFEAMRSGDWQGVKRILSTKTLTSAELEEKHGVSKFSQNFVQQINSSNSRRKFAILRPFNV